MCTLQNTKSNLTFQISNKVRSKHESLKNLVLINETSIKSLLTSDSKNKNSDGNFTVENTQQYFCKSIKRVEVHLNENCDTNDNIKKPGGSRGEMCDINDNPNGEFKVQVRLYFFFKWKFLPFSMMILRFILNLD